MAHFRTARYNVLFKEGISTFQRHFEAINARDILFDAASSARYGVVTPDHRAVLVCMPLLFSSLSHHSLYYDHSIYTGVILLVLASDRAPCSVEGPHVETPAAIAHSQMVHCPGASTCKSMKIRREVLLAPSNPGQSPARLSTGSRRFFPQSKSSTESLPRSITLFRSWHSSVNQ